MTCKRELAKPFFLLACLLAPAANARDVETGRQIAQRWCSGCHEITSAPAKTDLIPSFGAVAAKPGTTEISLHAFLSTPHRNMPDYSLTRQEISDVSAYIVSLKQ